MGFSSRKTVLILYALTLFFSMLALGTFWFQGRLVAILFGFGSLAIFVCAWRFVAHNEWFDLKSYLKSPLRLREETRYALALARWLEMSASRAHSLAELWDDFQFMAEKLNFTRIKLVMPEGEKEWETSDAPSPGVAELSRRIELKLESAMVLEFGALEDSMPGVVFEQLTELAAESWVKACSRWQRKGDRAVSFAAFDALALPSVSMSKKSRAFS
jgi:hypothetical protein